MKNALSLLPLSEVFFLEIITDHVIRLEQERIPHLYNFLMFSRFQIYSAGTSSLQTNINSRIGTVPIPSTHLIMKFSFQSCWLTFGFASNSGHNNFDLHRHHICSYWPRFLVCIRTRNINLTYFSCCSLIPASMVSNKYP